MSIPPGQDDMEGAAEATTSLTRTPALAGKNRVKQLRYIVTNGLSRIETSYLDINNY